MIFSFTDIADFRSWLRLNLDGVTWQGRFEREFEDFWAIFFGKDLEFSDIMSRFDYAIEALRIGPLNSWFNWLRERFLSYSFIKKGLSIYEISEKSSYSAPEVACILRNYFLEVYPYLDDEISEKFQVGNMASPNLLLNYSEFLRILNLQKEDFDNDIDEIMPSLEVTLYDEWGGFLKKMKSDFGKRNFSIQQLRSSQNLRRVFIFLTEIFVLAGIIWGAVLLTKKINTWYEKVLVDEIRILGPQLDWLDKTLTFKGTEEKSQNSPEVDADFDLIEKEELSESADLIDILDGEGRSGTESNLILTSWDSLPKDFNAVDLEASDYEELETKGYRDSRYGSTKVYRILMKSSDSLDTFKKIQVLLNKYEVTQVDNVRPGTKVPGGMYYNVYVPRTFLKEFMAKVMEVGDASLYESRTKTDSNPVGKNKVFIWVKTH